MNEQGIEMPRQKPPSMDGRQLEILGSLFRTAWPDEGASSHELNAITRWMEVRGVPLAERVALTEACLGHSDPEMRLEDEQSRQDALELLVGQGFDHEELLQELAERLAIGPDDLEMLRLRAHKEPSP